MTNSQSVEQDGIVAGNIFAMLDNANRGVNRMKFISLYNSDTVDDFEWPLKVISSHWTPLQG